MTLHSDLLLPDQAIQCWGRCDSFESVTLLSLLAGKHCCLCLAGAVDSTRLNWRYGYHGCLRLATTGDHSWVLPPTLVALGGHERIAGFTLIER